MSWRACWIPPCRIWLDPPNSIWMDPLGSTLLLSKVNLRLQSIVLLLFSLLPWIGGSVCEDPIPGG